MAMRTGKPHFLFNPNKKKRPSRKKNENLVKHVKKLVSLPDSKWKTNALKMAEKRLEKYGLNKNKVLQAK